MCSNPSATLAETITNISYVNLEEDVSGGIGAVFIRLHFLTEKLLAEFWEATGQELFYPSTDTLAQGTAMIVSGLNLTLKPHERLVVVRSRLGGGILEDPTIARLTLSGYTHTP